VKINYHYVPKMAKKNITGLKKGAEILRCFDLEHLSLSAKEIAQRVRIPQGSIYRYLDTLYDCGLLIRDPDSRKYRLGYLLLQMGNIVSASMDLVGVVTPHINDLSAVCGETSLLSMRSGWRTVCVGKKETDKWIKVSLEIGQSLPLHAGAASKILLAYEAPSFIEEYLSGDELVKLTESTTTDPHILRKQLDATRKEGFVFADEDVNIGVAAISAPIFDAKGRIAASLTVAGPSERIIRNKSKLIKSVKDKAAEASFALGYRREYSH
jgi:DNA-binding IclR family transcriptional regulator